MTYEPRPGTVAFRALAHMELLHKGSEIPSGTLANALGIETGALITSLVPAVNARAIFRRQKGGHVRSPVFWSLVDHNEPKGAAGAARRPETVKETTQAADAHNVGGDDAKRDGGPAAPRGSTDLVVPTFRAQRGRRDNGLDIDAVHRRRDNVIDMEHPPVRDSQHVLKAEAARPDATDRETPAMQRPGVGPMGTCQPADAGAACDHGVSDGDRCAQCASEISAGAASDEPILVGGAAPAVADAHEHFARATIDQAAPLPSTPAARPEVKPITSTERPLSVREHVRSIEGAVPPDPRPPAPPAPGAPLPRVRAGTAPARWGIFSDGELHIEKAGQRIVLERAELEAFVAFLERMGEPA